MLKALGKGTSIPLIIRSQYKIAESQLAPVVDGSLTHQGEWSDNGDWIIAGQWFLVITEINQGGFIESGLDVAAGMTIKFRVHLFPMDVSQNVFNHSFHLEVDDRAGFGGGDIIGIAHHPYILPFLGLQCEFVGRDEIQGIAHPRLLDHV